MKTAVMTDTNSGIMKAEADSMGIFLISMPERNIRFRRWKEGRIRPADAGMYYMENVNHPTVKYLERSVHRSIR